jgi:hypothetical protein
MNNENNLIKLRAHHLLCLQGYQGYGYDERFKENLENKLNILKKNKVKVILTSSPDDLCKMCPNLKENICIGTKSSNESFNNNNNNNNNKIIKKDLTIIKEIKIDINNKYLFKDLIKIVNNVFIKKSQLKDICLECQWTDECLWYQSREN